MSNVLNPIQAFYRRAIDRDELAYNPADADRPADRRRRSTEADRLAAREAAGLIAALARNATARSGRRRSTRACGAASCRRFAGCDVDLGASLIRVERGWDQSRARSSPSRAPAAAAVPLLAILRDYLDEHCCATLRGGEALVFGRTATLPFAPMAVGKRAKRAWKAAKLEPITLHECRHTFASLLIDSGANPKAIQEFMGHSKIQTTFDVYGHLMPGSRDEVRERMDAYLEGALGRLTGSGA